MNQSELIEKVAQTTELNQAAAGQAVVSPGCPRTRRAGDRHRVRKCRAIGASRGRSRRAAGGRMLVHRGRLWWRDGADPALCPGHLLFSVLFL